MTRLQFPRVNRMSKTWMTWTHFTCPRGSAEKHPKSGHDPLERPQGPFGLRRVGQFGLHAVDVELDVIARRERRKETALIGRLRW
jgi:hypothetical protein